MGDLSTAEQDADGVRCACGSYFPRLADSDGAWRVAPGVVVPAGYCRSCTLGRLARPGGAYGVTLPERSDDAALQVPEAQAPRERVGRRRSDVPTQGGSSCETQ